MVKLADLHSKLVSQNKNKAKLLPKVIIHSSPMLKINHFHHRQQTPAMADPQSSSVPCRLLCNRLEVLIHLTLLRVMCGVGSTGGEMASKSVTAGMSWRQPVLAAHTVRGSFTSGLKSILCCFFDRLPGLEFNQTQYHFSLFRRKF